MCKIRAHIFHGQDRPFQAGTVVPHLLIFVRLEGKIRRELVRDAEHKYILAELARTHSSSPQHSCAFKYRLAIGTESRRRKPFLPCSERFSASLDFNGFQTSPGRHSEPLEWPPAAG